MNAVAEKETSTAPAQAQPLTATKPANPNYVTPRVHIAETKEGYVIEAELPGVNKEGLTLNVEANVLTIEGRRPAQTVTGNLVYRESRPAVYRRVFELDTDVDAAQISGRINQGILTVQLPKAEQVKPRKIEIS